jgi:hypothetical protein
MLLFSLLLVQNNCINQKVALEANKIEVDMQRLRRRKCLAAGVTCTSGRSFVKLQVNNQRSHSSCCRVFFADPANLLLAAHIHYAHEPANFQTSRATKLKQQDSTCYPGSGTWPSQWQDNERPLMRRRAQRWRCSMRIWRSSKA